MRTITSTMQSLRILDVSECNLIELPVRYVQLHIVRWSWHTSKFQGTMYNLFNCSAPYCRESNIQHPTSRVVGTLKYDPAVCWYDGNRYGLERKKRLTYIKIYLSKPLLYTKPLGGAKGNCSPLCTKDVQLGWISCYFIFLTQIHCQCFKISVSKAFPFISSKPEQTWV